MGFRPWGVQQSQDWGTGQSAIAKGWGWERCFGQWGHSAKHLPRRMLSGLGPRSLVGRTLPTPALPGLGQWQLSASWTINAMHWSSKNVAIFLCLFFYLCC